MDRRRLLQSGLAASFASLLPSRSAAARAAPPAAMLVPLSGPHAALGRSMARAGTLAQAGDKHAFATFDTGGTPAGAAAAAALAVKRGSGVILGPVFAAEVRPVLAAVKGRVPVITFSNDLGLLDSGAFLMGITADQTVAPLLAYARARGVRRIGILRDTSPWGLQVAAAGRRGAERGGLSLVAGNDPGDALLCSGDPPALAALARKLRGSGVQLLGTFAGLDADPAILAALEGAWLSAPDPAAFADFAGTFEAQNGAPPGVIAGLAYDAVRFSQTLRQGGGSDRSAVLAATGFKGVCGDLRFRDNGSAGRGMAILAVEHGSYRIVDRSALA